MNSASVQGGDGGTLRLSSFLRMSPSMKLLRVAAANSFGSGRAGSGEAMRLTATRLEYQTVTAASPWPATVTLPSALTAATRSSLLENLAQRVTSSAWPSEYQARTSTCSVSFGFSTAAAGSTSSRWMAGS